MNSKGRCFIARKQESQDLKSGVWPIYPKASVCLFHTLSTFFFSEEVKKKMLNCLPHRSTRFGEAEGQGYQTRKQQVLGRIQVEQGVSQAGEAEVASFLAWSPLGSFCNRPQGNPILSCFGDLQHSKGQRLVLSAKILVRFQGLCCGERIAVLLSLGRFFSIYIRTAAPSCEKTSVVFRGQWWFHPCRHSLLAAAPKHGP